MSSSHVLTATSGTCGSIRLPSPTMAWSRVPSRMRAHCSASPVSTSRRVCGWKRLDRVTFHNAPSSRLLCRDEDYYRGMSAAELFDIYSSTIIESGWLRCTTSLNDTAYLHPGLTPIVGRSRAVLDYWSVVIVEPKIHLTGLLGFKLFGTSMRHSISKENE